MHSQPIEAPRKTSLAALGDMVDNNLPVNCVNTWENDTLATDNQGDGPRAKAPR